MAKFEYQQRDLGCSAFLLTVGYCLIGLEKQREGFFSFAFDDPLGTADQDSKSFFAGAPANAERLLHNLRRLKSLLRSEKHPHSQKGIAQNESRHISHQQARP